MIQFIISTCSWSNAQQFFSLTSKKSTEGSSEPSIAIHESSEIVVTERDSVLYTLCYLWSFVPPPAPTKNSVWNPGYEEVHCYTPGGDNSWAQWRTWRDSDYTIMIVIFYRLYDLTTAVQKQTINLLLPRLHIHSCSFIIVFFLVLYYMYNISRTLRNSPSVFCSQWRETTQNCTYILLSFPDLYIMP